jgi:PAS domain S-box-containing protein
LRRPSQKRRFPFLDNLIKFPLWRIPVLRHLALLGGKLAELEAIYRSAPVGLCVLDRKLRYVRVNDRLAEMNGVPASRHIGRTVREIVPELADQAEARMRQVIRTGRPAMGIEITGTTAIRPGEKRTWLEHWMPIKGPGGSAVGLNIVVEEITRRKKAEASRRASEQLFRSVVLSAPIPVMVHDLDGRLIIMSREVTRLTGYARRDVTGREDWIHRAEAHAGGSAGFMLGEGNAGAPPVFPFPEGERTIRCKDGGMRVWLYSAPRWLKQADGSTVVVTTALDITERKAAEIQLVEVNERLKELVSSRTRDLEETVQKLELESRERRTVQEELERRNELLHKVIDNIPVMITLYDHRARFLLCNREFEKSTGWTREEVSAMDLMAACFPDPICREEAWAFMEEATGEWRDFLVAIKNGGKLDSRWANIRLSDGTQVGIGIDISDRKAYEEEIIRARMLAEERAGKLQALASAISDAEARERDRIAAILHDELQQLLVGAKFQMDTFGTGSSREEAENDLRSSVLSLIRQAIESCRSLSYELSPPKVASLGLVGGIKWLSEQMKQKYGLEVALAGEENVQVSQTPLQRCLIRAVQELLFNVRKHAGVRAATVKLSKRADGVEVAVEDRGRGFSAESPDIPKSSTGFGIMRIRERLDMIGGELKVESSPGGGTRVVLFMPDAGKPKPPVICGAEERAEEPAAVPRPARSADRWKLRVLLADDHSVMRQGLASLLDGERDLEIIGQASNGREAIEMAEAGLPDVVIMDVAMPEIDGIEACRKIKSKHPSIRIVGLSMFQDQAIAEGMIAAGAEAFLPKTGPPEELLAAVRGAPVGGEEHA